MFKESLYEDVICGQEEVRLLSSTLCIFLYCVDGLLVDSGPLSLAKESIRFFQAHEINQVALTHVHEDHCGMAPWLQENKKVSVYLHKNSLAAASGKAALPLYRLRLWGERHPFQALAMPDEIKTPNHRFQTIDTPGHCAFHVVLYEKEKGWLFTGDVFVKVKQHVAFREENLSMMIDSLTKLLQLDFHTVFCAHSGVLTDGYQLMEDKLAFLLDLQEKVRKLEARGLTPRQINRELFPIKHPMTDMSEGEGSSYNMVNTV